MQFERRRITPQELAVLQAALTTGAEQALSKDIIASAPNLQAVDACTCGCDSVDFELPEGNDRPGILANAIGQTPAGGQVGVIVWGHADRITGLEVYDLDAGPGGIRLPVPASIRPWQDGV